MKAKNIVVGCFVGGFIGTLVAFLVAPKLLALGMLAGIAVGFITGYVACDFLAFISAIPGAWHLAMTGTKAISKSLVRAERWVRKNYVDLFSFFFSALPGYAFAVVMLYSQPKPVPIAGWVVMIAVVGTMAAVCSVGLFFAVPHYIMKLDKKVVVDGHWDECDYDEVRQNKGYVLRHTLTSVAIVSIIGWPYLLSWLIPKWVGIGLYVIARVVARFLWELFRLIHSQERILCGVDSALGCITAFFIFRGHANSPLELLFVCVCGGLIGAATGIIDYKLVTKRLLKFQQT